MTTANAPRRTPLYEAHVRAGGKMVEFAGWEMPVQYEGLVAEHHAVRTAAGLFDVSHMGEIEVSGAGAEAFLQGLTPNDVGKLVPGRAHYSGLLNADGGYLDDLLVYRLAEQSFLLVVNAANRDSDRAWIEHHAPADVRVVDRSDDYGLLALQGPAAAGILAPLTDVDLGAIRYYGFAHGAVAGCPTLVSRTGYTGEDGFELYVGAGDAEGLWEQLLRAGRGAGLVPAGLGARDTLRLEAGMALYGHELDETSTPWQANLGWVVKLAKAEKFIGRSALEREKEAGPARRLVGFRVEGRGIARHGHRILDGDTEIGAVTSGTWSPTLEGAVGMAYVPSDKAGEGTGLTIDVRGRRLSGRVVKLPFYKRGE